MIVCLYARLRSSFAMKIVVTGANGLVGSALCSFLKAKQHEVVKLGRGGAAAQGGFKWDPDTGLIERECMEGSHAVVHLAGESVAQRWSKEAKAKIMESRKKGTRLLAETLSALKSPPSVFVSASAIGFYGERGSEPLTEESAPGQGFLAEVCKVWEQEAAAASKNGIRTVNLRIGVVLSRKGGALAKMLPPFLLGLGGVLGSGQQYMSWISLSDLVEAIYFVICNESMSGPVNAVSPNPVTNSEFTAVLGRALGRPTLFPVPALGAKLLFGQMAEEMLLSGAKVLPRRLEVSGFKFAYPSIDSALKLALSES
jgi:uncharacterized protein